MKRTILFGLALTSALTVQAQVLPFNESGVTMGHHHLLVPDVDAQKKIWVDALGGQLSGNGPLTFVKFPGVFVILTGGKGTEGTKGSAIDHIAFNVKDLKSVRAKLAAAGAAISNESDARFDAVLPGGIDTWFAPNPGTADPNARSSGGLLTALRQAPCTEAPQEVRSAQ